MPRSTSYDLTKQTIDPKGISKEHQNKRPDTCASYETYTKQHEKQDPIQRAISKSKDGTRISKSKTTRQSSRTNAHLSLQRLRSDTELAPAPCRAAGMNIVGRTRSLLPTTTKGEVKMPTKISHIQLDRPGISSISHQPASPISTNVTRSANKSTFARSSLLPNQANTKVSVPCSVQKFQDQRIHTLSCQRATAG